MTSPAQESACMFLRALAIGLSAALLLGGCASSTTKPTQYSGFLGDYSQLQPAQSASGAPVMRWISPVLDLQRYRSVVVEKPLFYPDRKSTRLNSSHSQTSHAVFCLKKY